MPPFPLKALEFSALTQILDSRLGNVIEKSDKLLGTLWTWAIIKPVAIVTDSCEEHLPILQIALKG